MASTDNESIAAIHSIPAELLISIFAQGEAEWHKDDDEEIRFPVLVSRVCRRWREVAIGAPSLWTSVYITPRSPMLKVARLFIDRSCTCPIDITFEWQYEYEPSPEKFGSMLSNLVCSSASRWRTLVIEVCLHYQMQEIMQRIPWPELVSSLDSLQLVQHDRSWSEAEVQYDCFKHSFSLSKLSLRRVTLPWLIFSAPNLRVLDIRRLFPFIQPSYEELRTLLTNLPCLEHLTLRRAGPDMDVKADYEPILLPSLLSLNLAGAEEGDEDEELNKNLLGLFSTPALTSLAIEDISFGMVTQHLTAEKNRYAKVTRFSLAGANALSVPDQFYAAFPILERFSISANSDLENIILDRLLINESETTRDKTIVWPLLKRLDYSYYPPNDAGRVKSSRKKELGIDIDLNFEALDTFTTTDSDYYEDYDGDPSDIDYEPDTYDIDGYDDYYDPDSNEDEGEWTDDGTDDYL